MDLLRRFFGGKPSGTCTVSDVRVYPIKSCRGSSVSSAQLTPQGLDFDRNWMIVDAGKLTFLSMRELPRMTLIEPRITTDPSSPTEELLEIRVPNLPDPLVIRARPTRAWLAANTTFVDVELRKEHLDGYAYGPLINEALSSFLDHPVMLVYKGPTPRVLGGNAAPSILGRQATINFPDRMPLLIMSETSLVDLNRMIKEADPEAEEVEMERFRPNVVVTGTAGKTSPEIGGQEDISAATPVAWSEDQWKRLRFQAAATSPDTSLRNFMFITTVGLFLQLLPYFTPNLVTGFLLILVYAIFVVRFWLLNYAASFTVDIVHLCTRCPLPNVNPSTGETYKEPLSALNKHRRVGVENGKKLVQPCFGILGVPRTNWWHRPARMEVGMDVEVLKLR